MAQSEDKGRSFQVMHWQMQSFSSYEFVFFKKHWCNSNTVESMASVEEAFQLIDTTLSLYSECKLTVS